MFDSNYTLMKPDSVTLLGTHPSMVLEDVLNRAVPVITVGKNIRNCK
jgi:hypothetical protein